MTRIEDVMKSQAYHKQAKAELLKELLTLADRIYDDKVLSNVDKFNTLCDGYETIRQIMEEIGE